MSQLDTGSTSPGNALSEAVNNSAPTLKKEPVVTTAAEKQSLSSNSNSSPHLIPQAKPWAPSLRINTPAWGLAAALSTLASCVGAIIIVTVSDGQNVEAWHLQPSVCLAILMAAVNATLMFALAGGVVNTWWYSLSKGATVAQAQRNYAFGMSLWEAMCAGKYTGFLAIATVFGTWAIFVTDPLMQKSTTIVAATSNRSINVTASIAPLIPYGYTGLSVVVDETTYRKIVSPSSPVINVSRDYLNKVPITTGFTGCEGNCTGIVPAAGFAINCGEERIPVDFEAPRRNWTAAGNFSDLSYMVPQLAFSTSFASWGPELAGYLTVSYVDSINQNCAGFITVRSCNLTAATIEYPISIRGDVITLGDVSSPKVVALQNSSAYSRSCMVDCGLTQTTAVTVNGIIRSAEKLFNSSVMIGANPPSIHTLSWGVTSDGSISNQYQNMTAPDFEFFSTISNCNMSYLDPTSDILQAMNEMMFRTALKASNTSLYSYFEANKDQYVSGGYELLPGVDGIPRNTTITMSQTSAIQVYSSDYKFLGASIAIIVISLILIMPLYYGFWKFGRRVSLSPLEIAKAFEAPLLASAGSNMEADELLKVVGSMRVRYGEVMREEGGVQICKLKIAEAEEVQAPRRAAIYH